MVILDECTSAIGQRVERSVYRILEQRNISVVTVSHRTTALQWHRQVLSINGPDSWSLEQVASEARDDLIRTESAAIASAEHQKKQLEEQASKLAQMAEQRSAAYKTVVRSKAKQQAPTMSSVRRCWMILTP